eukprot:3309025-Amphidinium_carterae.3
MASLASRTAGIRETALSTADKIINLDENVKQEYLAHGNCKWSSPSRGLLAQCKITKVVEESPASSQGRPHQSWADSPMSRGSMLPPPCAPPRAKAMETPVGAASSEDNIPERAGAPVDQRLLLL